VEADRRHLIAGGAALALGIPAAVRAERRPALSQQRLSDFADAAQRYGIKGLVIAGREATLLTRGRINEPSRIASIRKSFLSALLGMAIRDGRLDPDATIGSLGIRDYSPLTPVESRATVRQLMQARSGVYLPAAAETAQMRGQRPRRGAYAPGTHFYYNNWDFNVLGEIYQRATGEDLFAAVAHRLAGPLGFQDFDRRRHTWWEYDRERSRFPAYNMSLSARDLARFGQLYLRRGSWGGRQLIPASWIRESTTPYSATGGTGWWSGYGYMWWVASNRSGASAGNLPPGAFTAAGAGGRYVSVLPGAGLTVAMQPDEHAGRTPIPLYADQTLLNGLLALLL